MTIDLHDLQGNLVRGVRAAFGRHFLLRMTDAVAASRMITSLTPGEDDADGDGIDDDGLRISTAAEWADRPPYFLTLSMTYHGLKALGVPAGVLSAFPVAFRDGPARVNVDTGLPVPLELGDAASLPGNPKVLDPNDPGHPDRWEFGSAATPEVHCVLSLYTDPEEGRPTLDEYSARLQTLFSAHGIVVHSAHDACGLPGMRVHFGYRDGIAQPRIEGVPGPVRSDMQPAAQPGDFLMGKSYRNQYNGNYLLGLPAALCDNGTYGVFRKVDQDVRAFENYIEEAGQRANMDKELVAAKLMGRWRNGVPLTHAPDTNPPSREESLDAYDYAPTASHPTYFDDAEGMRCPIGSHARRMNPRSAMVMGKPHSRRVIRRGMPYGPEFDPSAPDDGERRGLIGYFICGDIEGQYEFMVGVWGNKDYSTSGIRGTVDPIIGVPLPARSNFTIRTNDGRDPITLSGLPRWVTSRGAAYCFFPGINGLRYLGDRQWETSVHEAPAASTMGVSP